METSLHSNLKVLVNFQILTNSEIKKTVETTSEKEIGENVSYFFRFLEKKTLYHVASSFLTVNGKIEC